jgi:hypothetical protein
MSVQMSPLNHQGRQRLSNHAMLVAGILRMGSIDCRKPLQFSGKAVEYLGCAITRPFLQIFPFSKHLEPGDWRRTRSRSPL